MTNLNIAKLYLATNTTATATEIDAAIADGSAATAVTALTGTTLLNAIYQASFGRDADAEGLAYWGASTLTGDALITAINAGAAVYVANPAYPENVAIAANDTVVAVNKATAEAAATTATVGASAAALVSVTEVASTVTVATEAIDNAEYAAAVVTYDAAVVTAAASSAAATAAAATVGSVALATASATAAATAKTDADLVVTAATAVTAAATATVSAADDITAATAAATATAAQTVAATAVTTAATAVTTAQAAADAAAAVGTTFTLTTSDDTGFFGTSKSDTWNGDQDTYNSGDIIVDSSTVDNDTLEVTFTDAVDQTATVVGVENINFNLNASSVTSDGIGAGASGTDDWDIDAANLSAGTLTANVTKTVTTVTDATVSNLKSGITLATNVANLDLLTSAANADLTVNMTSTDATTVDQVTGAIDTLTVTSAGDVTLVDSLAEESITITSAGKVDVTDVDSADGNALDVDLTITAADDVNVDDYSNTGDISVTTTSGDIVVGGTDNDADGDITLSTDAGHVTVTNADDMTGTLTVTATGAADEDTTFADATTAGDVVISEASLASEIIITASNDVRVDDIAAATDITIVAGGNIDLGVADAAGGLITALTDITLTAGADSVIDAGAVATENVTLSSTVAVDVTSEAPIVFDFEDGSLDTLETLTITGDNSVTVAMEAANILTAVTAFATLSMTDTSTGTSRLRLDDAIAADTDLSMVAFDEIEFAANQTVDAASTVANGANIIVSATMTDLQLTSAAEAGNSITLNVVEDAMYDFTLLTTTNIQTVNLNVADDVAAGSVTITEAVIGTAGADKLVIAGAGDVVLGAADVGDDVDTVITATKVDASAVTGTVTVYADDNAEILTGTKADTITVTGAGDYTIDGGDGVDTLVVTDVDSDDVVDLTGNTLTLTSIEKIDIALTGGIKFDGTQMSTKDYLIQGAATVEVVAEGSGAIVDLSDITASVITSLTLTGSDGGDTLTAADNFLTNINGGLGDDTIYGGTCCDIIDGEAGDDTININVDTKGNATTVVLTTGSTDTINNFNAGVTDGDLLYTEALAAGNVAGKTAIAADSAAVNLTDQYVGVFADGSDGVDVDSVNTSITDYTDLEDVAAFLEANLDTVKTETFAIVINDLANDKAYVYNVDEDLVGDDTTIVEGEVALVGVINISNETALTVDNISMA